jgi:PIN domain nuclease of toxin-antitoxin system
MRLLLDTHLLLWAAFRKARLSSDAVALIADGENVLTFSTISLVEVAIKYSLGRPDFQVDPSILRRGLLDNGYTELPVNGDHAVAVAGLPPIHKDPFDRLLVAQATVEGITLITEDSVVGQYPGPVRLV